MTNVGIGGGKGRKERDTHHDAAHFAVANVVARHATAGLIAEVGVEEKHARVCAE